MRARVDAAAFLDFGGTLRDRDELENKDRRIAYPTRLSLRDC